MRRVGLRSQIVPRSRTPRWEAGLTLFCVPVRKLRPKDNSAWSRVVPGRGGAWHSDRDLYPINTFILGACDAPKIVLGAGDTEMEDSGAV